MAHLLIKFLTSRRETEKPGVFRPTVSPIKRISNCDLDVASRSKSSITNARLYPRTAGAVPGTVKNEAVESCPESITTTGRTNFLGSAVSSAKKKRRTRKDHYRNREHQDIKSKRISMRFKIYITVNCLNKLPMLYIISAYLKSEYLIRISR